MIKTKDTLTKIYIDFKDDRGNISLDLTEAMFIHQWYEAACTAEYMLENEMVAEEDALKTGYEVRRLMGKYELTEEEAIAEVLE